MDKQKIKIKIPKLIPISKLKLQSKNIKIHTKAQIELLGKLFEMGGYSNPIVIDKKFKVWAGHGRIEAALAKGMKEISYVFLEDLSEKDKKAYMLLENKSNESEWNLPNVRHTLGEIQDFDFEPFNVSFDSFYMRDREFIPGANSPTRAEIQEVTIPDEAPKRANLGDVFQLGDHFVMCGDSTNPDHREKLLNGAKPDTVKTDPPYSSGGRQEAHKKQGSIGSKRITEDGHELSPKIKMDDLSTRGYVSLIKNSLYGIEADILYMFTDWRMWDWTREAVESAGFPVRNMIVWDKLTPGMGIQWRGQHELICFCKRTSLGGPYHKGNVLNIKRSGNEHHPTEKPITLLVELIENTNGSIVYDPFAGSGSTMIACEQLQKKCYSMELDPLFVDIMIKRWEDFTQKKAVKL